MLAAKTGTYIMVSTLSILYTSNGISFRGGFLKVLQIAQIADFLINYIFRKHFFRKEHLIFLKSSSKKTHSMQKIAFYVVVAEYSIDNTTYYSISASSIQSALSIYLEMCFPQNYNFQTGCSCKNFKFLTTVDYCVGNQ